MKNILILILALCATMASEAATTKTRPSETAKLSEKVDSLTSVIDALSHNIQTITKTQEALSVRMAETREDYMTFLTDSHETRNWTIGIISLIVAALGVAAPLLLSYLAKQKSETLFRTLKQNINSIAEQINRDREIINTQLSDIRTIKDQIDKIQAKIKASETNARQSQQRAMISSLFSQALKEEDKNTAIKLYSRILKIDPKYADALNNRSLFFSVESREEFSALLTKYDLAQLVVAGTLLTPYLTQLESVTFVLKTLTMFAIVFVVSLVFILYISNYVDVFVNRKRYALKEIMGFSHFKILKSRYIVWAMEIIASVILTAINYYFACFFAIMLLDYLFCELLYRTYIKKALYEIEKGA